MIAFDFLKHITSLSLVSIGGILALLQASGDKLGRGEVISMALIGGSAVLGTIVLNALTASVLAGRRSTSYPRILAILLQIVAAPFLLGVGIFVGVYVRKLG